MPELPDIVVYVDALRRRILGQALEAVRIGSPFVVRSVHPPIGTAAGRRVSGLSRLGKRIVIALEPDVYLVIHLMIAGRQIGRAACRGRGEISVVAGSLK